MLTYAIYALYLGESNLLQQLLLELVLILRERLLLEYVLHPRVYACVSIRIRQHTHTSAYAYVSIRILRERLLLEYVLHPRRYVLV
jgi:hypothetical protein